MSSVILRNAQGFSGRARIPGDKSISHRALILGSLARGRTRVSGLLRSADVFSTWKCMEQLGVAIRELSNGDIEIEGMGLRGLKAPEAPLDCENSGTTMRLLMGILSAQSFNSTLVGDYSLIRRPMKRIAEPLRKMGAVLELRDSDFAPIMVRENAKGMLQPLSYDLPIASAQLKSALLLAGLFADGRTVLSGKIASRDHTERMLSLFGIPVDQQNSTISVRGGMPLQGTEIRVPGDFSTAAFWIAAAAMVPGASVQVDSVSLNPTRLGFLRVLQRMGASIAVETRVAAGEPSGDIFIRQSPLQGVRVTSEEVPDLIDELPTLAVLATQAHGLTEVRGASELRVKESDRIESTGRALRAMGARITLFEDGFSVQGPQKLRGGRIETNGDHRIAMAFSLAALIAEGETEILEPECVSVSYPAFFDTLGELCASGARK